MGKNIYIESDRVLMFKIYKVCAKIKSKNPVKKWWEKWTETSLNYADNNYDLLGEFTSRWQEVTFYSKKAIHNYMDIVKKTLSSLLMAMLFASTPMKQKRIALPLIQESTFWYLFQNIHANPFKRTFLQHYSLHYRAQLLDIESKK